MTRIQLPADLAPIYEAHGWRTVYTTGPAFRWGTDTAVMEGGPMAEIPDTREGRTRKVRVGPADLYVTINGIEGKPVEVLTALSLNSDEGIDASTAKGLLRSVSRLASMCLQSGVPALDVARTLRGDRYSPEGGPGQPSSLSDAIARLLSPPEVES